MVAKWWGRIVELLTTADNMMSRSLRVVTSRFRGLLHRETHDWARPDYDYWRRAYYARVRGLELSGLFIKPLVGKIAAWTLGRAPEWRLESESTQAALDEWWAEHHPTILRAWRGALKQGDAFVAVNPDLTLTIVRPDTVDPIVAPDDFAQVIGWRVTQVVKHPTEPARRMTVIDEFFAERRVRRVEMDGRPTTEQTWANPLGRPMLVHIANQPGEGETFGHAEAEALVEILLRYGRIFEAAIEGNELQGRPTPVLEFEKAADLDKFWQEYGRTETRELPDGRIESSTTLAVDLSQILTVAGAKFSYQSPGSFSADTQTLLGLMFYLILQHCELPEFVMGNAVSSSHASVETQMPVFEKFIEQRRGEMTAWLTEIAEIVLGLLSLLQPGVTAERPTLQWPKLTQDHAMTLETLRWALAEGLLDRRTALMLAPVEVEDIDAVLAAAEEEREQMDELAEERAFERARRQATAGSSARGEE